MKEKLKLNDLNPPLIVTSNTFYWRPCPGASGRRYSERKKLEEVRTWLEQVIKNFNLNNLEITQDENEIIIRDSKEKKVIGYFRYGESCRRVYKRQNFKELLKLISSHL